MPEIYKIFESLAGETAERYNRYTDYLNWFRGNHELFHQVKEGRPFYKTNLCSRTVRMLSNFTLSQMFDVHAKRTSEKGFSKEEMPEYREEINLSEEQEKAVRKVFEINQQGKKEFTSGMQGGLTLGDTVFYLYQDEEKNPCLQNIFPGHIRAKFRSDNFDELEYFFVTKALSKSYAKKKYKAIFSPLDTEVFDVSAIWDSQLFYQGEYVLEVTAFDEENKYKFINGNLISEEKHGLPKVPAIIIPSLENPYSPWGDAILKDIISINKEYNEAISDESAIARIFAHPKVVIRNATQKDIDNIKANWKSGVIASRTNLEVQPFQFTGQLFPIEQRISKIEDRFFRQSGLGPAVFGMPPGSINTGASLTVQYAPTLQQAQIIWSSWEPRLLQLIDLIIEMLKIKGQDSETKINYKELFKKKPQWELKAPFRMPRDEAIVISNEVQKYQVGFQSLFRTMTNLGIESPEDELALSVWEKLVLAQILPQEVSEQGKKQVMSPMMGAEIGGQMRAEETARAAQERI